MTDAKKLQQERTQINHDLYEYRIPKRLPVVMTLNHAIIIQYAGMDLASTQFNFKQIAAPAKELCEKIYSDSCPIPGGGASSRFPS